MVPFVAPSRNRKRSREAPTAAAGLAIAVDQTAVEDVENFLEVLRKRPKKTHNKDMDRIVRDISAYMQQHNRLRGGGDLHGGGDLQACGAAR